MNAALPVTNAVCASLLLVRGHAARRGRADPAAEQVEDRRGLRVVDRDLAAVDELAAADRGDPLERVAGQALVGVALEDEAGEVRVRLPARRPGSSSPSRRAGSRSSAVPCSRTSSAGRCGSRGSRSRRTTAWRPACPSTVSLATIPAACSLACLPSFGFRSTRYGANAPGQTTSIIATSNEDDFDENARASCEYDASDAAGCGTTLTLMPVSFENRFASARSRTWPPPTEFADERELHALVLRLQLGGVRNRRRRNCGRCFRGRRTCGRTSFPDRDGGERGDQRDHADHPRENQKPSVLHSPTSFLVRPPPDYPRTTLNLVVSGVNRKVTYPGRGVPNARGARGPASPPDAPSGARSPWCAAARRGTRSRRGPRRSRAASALRSSRA